MKVIVVCGYPPHVVWTAELTERTAEKLRDYAEVLKKKEEDK
jgi:hypothetical protein